MKKIIVITGPESTAKSTLTNELSVYFEAASYQEYAREYLAAKGSRYTWDDVAEIARVQLRQYYEARNSSEELVFFDTWLIITKVWFEWAYKRLPDWLEQAIDENPVDLYLLCKPDLPWEPDPLREHGGAEREQLFQIYKQELINRGFPFVEIGGLGDERVLNAIKAVKSIL
ncbi:AAA family ATPase [Gaoshiqia sp. Z1-71]|uniref:AAA family ATPase n=1 Tax=Gaoshiqia hydrogeniformans TaxID=3290090 RepID=UPI003BF8F71E